MTVSNIEMRPVWAIYQNVVKHNESSFLRKLLATTPSLIHTEIDMLLTRQRLLAMFGCVNYSISFAQ